MDYDVLLAAVRALFTGLFPAIASAEWTTWEMDDQVKLNKLMHVANDVYNDKLRRAYDRTIWDGHKSGKVAKSLEPVRQETVRKGTDASKPAPTAEDIFASILES